MKFLIERASDWIIKRTKPCNNAKLIKKDGNHNYWEVEVDNLKELISLIKEVDNDIIIGINSDKDFPNHECLIKIYDDYIE